MAFERIGIAPLSAEVGRYDAILLAVPSQHLREAAQVIAPELVPGTPVIACAKGIERGTHLFMTEVIAQSSAAALAPSPRPATMPAAMASTFLAAPPISTPRTSLE